MLAALGGTRSQKHRNSLASAGAMQDRRSKNSTNSFSFSLSIVVGEPIASFSSSVCAGVERFLPTSKKVIPYPSGFCTPALSGLSAP